MKYNLRFFNLTLGNETFIKKYTVDSTTSIPHSKDCVSIDGTTYYIHRASFMFEDADKEAMDIEYICEEPPFEKEWWEKP